MGHLVGDHPRLKASVESDLLQRGRQRLTDDLHARGLVTIQVQVVLQHVGCLKQGNSAASDNALFHSGLSIPNSILDAVLAFLQLHLGGGANLDHGHTAGQLSQTLVQLLTVVFGIGVLDLGTDLVHPTLNLVLGTGTFHNGGVVLGHHNLAGATQQRQVGGLQGQAHLFGNDLATGQNSHVLQLRLAAVAETRSLDGNGLEGAANLIHDQGRQGLALHVFGDNQQRLAGLHDLLQQRQQVLNIRDLGGNQKNVRILQHCLQTLHVGGKVTGDITLVEAHTLGDL